MTARRRTPAPSPAPPRPRRPDAGLEPRSRPRPLIGREAELQAWQDATAAARRSAGAVVIVAGEAGIGKSRLVTEFLASTGSAVRRMVGNCPPVAGTDLPYAPILQGLRDLSRSVPPAEWDRVVAIWPPEVASYLLPAPAGPDAAPQALPAAASLPELPVSPTAQVRFFEALLRGLVRLARHRPVAFVVEDLHWADQSTLDLLAYLASNLRTEPLLLLLTCRDELAKSHPLRRWLPEIRRLPQTTLLELPRLTQRQTADLMSSLLPATPAAGLVDAVFTRAEGNPLFTEVLLPETGGGTEGLPPLLRDLLSGRFADLSPFGRRLLGLAGAAGRRVSHELLDSLLDVAEDELDEALREVIDAQILCPAPDGQSFDFRHELFREAAYDDLLPGERRRLHRALGDALTSRPDLAAGGPHSAAGETAHHYVAASEWGKALPVAVEAGVAAERGCAFAEARQQFQRAAEIWDRVPDAGQRSPLPLGAILARAAQAADLSGDSPAAVDLVQRALDVASGDDRTAVALLHERRGTYHFNAGHAEEARAAFTTGLDLLPPEPPSAARARLLASLALLDMAWTRLEEAGRAARESIRQAQAVGAFREEGRARNALGVVTAYTGELDAGVGHLNDAVRLARQADDPDDLAAALINLGHVLGVAGRYDQSVRSCLDGYDMTRRLGLEREHGSFLLANAAESLLRAGRWPEAEGLLVDALARAPRGLRGFPVHMQSAWLALRRGRYDDTQRHLTEATSLLRDGGGGPSGWRRELLEAEAELATWQGRTADALRTVDEGLTLAELADEQRFAGPLVTSGLRAAADEAERARARREPAAATGMAAAADALFARARRLDPCPVDEATGLLPGTAALAAACAGERARLAGCPDPAPWQRCAREWRALGRPYETAYACWRQAEALFAAGQPEEGAEVLRAAYDGAARLGAGGLREEVEALAAWRRIALEVQVPAPIDAAQDRLGLTTRELEVLARVTAGETNGQIAKALFISAKTASVHVSNILRKLDVASREDAARIGRQLGLTPVARRSP